jgi:hypothetical protein
VIIGRLACRGALLLRCHAACGAISWAQACAAAKAARYRLESPL